MLAGHEFARFVHLMESPMSKLSVALAGFDVTKPVQSVETAVVNLIKGVKPDVETALEPELTIGVQANTNLVMKFLKLYAFGKAEACAREFLAYLATKRPALAPEINTLLAKIPA